MQMKTTVLYCISMAYNIINYVNNCDFELIVHPVSGF